VRYPTGKKIIVKDKVFAEVRLGSYIVEIPMLADINDNCILGVDFFKKIHLENIFKPIFCEQKEIHCCRLESFFDISTDLNCLFKESSKNLNKTQQQLCKKFNEVSRCILKKLLLGIVG